MSLISLIVIICVVGGLLWAINAYIPLEPTIKKILNVVVIFALIIWLLNVFGLLADLNAIKIGG